MEQLLSYISQLDPERGNHNKAFSDVLNKMLFFFESDRAWCLYPCDPETKHWRVPLERTRHRWPGAKNADIDIPTAEEDITTFNILLDAKKPVTYGTNADYPVPEYNKKVFSVQSLIAMAIYPKEGKSWVLGMHYCESEHHFSDEEIECFNLLGKKIEDVFDQLNFE